MTAGLMVALLPPMHGASQGSSRPRSFVLVASLAGLLGSSTGCPSAPPSLQFDNDMMGGDTDDADADTTSGPSPSSDSDGSTSSTEDGSPSEGSDSSTGADCTRPAPAEDCFNGIDDDCDGAPDCADSECGAQVQCVEVPPEFQMGIVVGADEACPDGFEADATELYADLDPGEGCAADCTCEPDPIRCETQIYSYASQTDCENDTDNNGGQMYGSVLTETCTDEPVYDGSSGGQRIEPFVAIQTCSAAGSAAPTPATWGSHQKLCHAAVGTRGCGETSACVPVETPPAATCMIASGGRSCPESHPARDAQWYTGLQDDRSCGACECEATGGSCQFAEVIVGNDWLCDINDPTRIRIDRPRVCDDHYSPPARVNLQNAQDPTCTVSAAVYGEVVGTGQQTMCCAS